MESTIMDKLNLTRLSGIALAFGSALFIINKFNDMSRAWLDRPIPDVIDGQNFVIVMFGQLLLVIGFLGYYFAYADRLNRAGKLGLGTLAGGTIALAIGHLVFTPLVQQEELFFLVIVGVLLMILGLVLFGA